eukprot:5353329-Lingulodinium_polyedra.AAC.1
MIEVRCPVCRMGEHGQGPILCCPHGSMRTRPRGCGAPARTAGGIPAGTARGATGRADSMGRLPRSQHDPP